jgi:hypothetical protein
MRGIVGLVLVLGLIAGASKATAAAPAEPCADLKVAPARAVLGQAVKLSQKQAVRERVCTAKVGSAVAATVRSRSSLDYDWVVRGLKDEHVLVKQLKPVAVGQGGYSYDLYASGGQSLAMRAIVFRSGQLMYSVEVPARRPLTSAKQLALARAVLRTARR